MTTPEVWRRFFFFVNIREKAKGRGQVKHGQQIILEHERRK